MGKIKLLSKYTANQIAAGEVVERPASVVKELIENAIDALANNIVIETRGGGLEYIRVSDNGSGIMHDDVEIAFLRHSTSKIENGTDLAHIETLGFRGEALASIAAVSHMTVRTRSREAESGTMARVEGGDIKEITSIGTPKGTTMEISNLFYNVPARLKFVKSARSENAYISDYVARMILARPEIAFRLTQNDKLIYQSSGDGEAKHALYSVYGLDTVSHACSLEYDDGYVKISGYVGNEHLLKSNRNSQSFFVNGRYIKSQRLSYALARAYETRLMAGRFPFCVISITINSGEIDVNVHPNKLDIRFKDEDRIFRALVVATRIALGDAPKQAQTPPDAGAQLYPINGRKEYDNPAEGIVPKPQPLSITDADIRNVFDQPQQRANTSILRESQHTIRTEYMRNSADTTATKTDIQIEALLTNQQSEQTNLDYGIEYQIIGLLFNCYWVIQQDENVFFVDQHAAHERRLYEQMVTHGLKPDSQLLLTPLIIKFTPIEYDILTSNLERFIELGFEIEEFGALTLSVRAVPYLLGEPQTERFLMDAVALLDARAKLNTTELKREALIQSACKHAVKAGDALDPAEIRELLLQFEREGIPLTCPHGRPVMIKMHKREFEKLFKRVL